MANVKELIDLMGREISRKEEELVVKAYKFAERAHEGQKRKGGGPYFNHVFETAKTLAQLGMDTQTVASGLLHDILEDTKVTKKELEAEFGSEVLFLVNGVTKLGTLKYHGRERYAENLRKLFVAMADDLRVIIIKFADRLHNLQTLRFLREDQRKRISIESLEIYARIANRLGIAKVKGEMEDAAFPYAHPEEYNQIVEIMKEKKDLYQKNLFEVQKELEKQLSINKVRVVEINHRIKRKYSLWKKLIRHGMDIEKIYDIVALRVIVDSIEECYKVLGIIHSIWNPLTGRIKDYIALPKRDGYRSLHTTIFTGSGKIAEIQIRTREMHMEANYGILARFTHREQDGKKINNDKLKLKWIEELKDLKYNPGDPKSFLKNLKMDFFSKRIFVLTPKGDVVDLPEDSSPIDFAYAIHSDIGDHISGAKINGKMSTIFSKLKNRDVVEITQNKNSHPSLKWLEHVKTTIAQRRINSYLEDNSLLNKLKSLGRS